MNTDLQPQLRGATLTLRPLTAADLEPLWQVARDKLLWAQHPDQTRHERAGFERFFASALECGAALTIVDNASGQPVGSTRYYEFDSARREVAIGYTFLARSHWGGAANLEMKRLMIEHAAAFADVIWFHVGAGNLRSRRAMEKIGAQLAFEARRPLHGEMIDFVYYRIDPRSWVPPH